SPRATILDAVIAATILDQSPLANAGGPYVGVVGVPVAFNGTGSIAAGTIASYSWNLGDGTSAGGALPTHAYAAAGTYTVRLRVTDGDGATSPESTTTVTVTATLPVVNVTWTQLVNVSATGNSLRKTVDTETWDAGAVSTKSIVSGDGYVEFTATETDTYRMCGLSHANTDVSYPDLDS